VIASMTPPIMRPYLRSALRLFVAVLLATLACAGTASAVPSLAEKAAAQALFEDGLQLMGAKRYAEACPKLEESERLDPALGTRFRLSECDEAIGRLASAWAGFLEVADLAHAAGQTDRETVARARAAAIEPKLSRVKVEVVQPDTPGLEVAHGSVIVGRGQWGTAVPIDPGTYSITATAPSKKPWRGSVTIAEDGSTATLLVPALDDAPTEIGPSPIPLTVGAPLAVTPLDAHPGRGARIAGYTLIGAGAAGVIASGVMGLVAKGNYDSTGAHCSATLCDPSGKTTTDGARQLAGAATAVFVVGAVAAVGGVVLVLTAPSGARRSSTSAALRVGPGACTFEGAF
jgi:hypothetical protein